MAEAIKGLSLGLGLDTAGIDQGLKQMKGKLALVSSEMKASMSAFDRGEKSVQKYEVQISGLNKKLVTQKATVNSARTEYEKMVTQHGEGSRQAERAATAYNNEVAAVNNLERHVEGLSAELRELEEQQRIANSGLTRMSESMTTAGANLTSFGDGMKKAGKSMSMYVTAPLVGLGAVVLKTGIDFEKSMSNVGAISGATGEDLAMLEEKAREMGAATSKSASESADALSYMALSGWDTTQMMEGLEPILRLSEAGNLDLAQASDLVTDSMSALGIEVKDLPGYLDAVAQTSRKSNTDIDSLMQAFLAVGGSFKNLNVPLDESNALLGIMANRGIKGAEAGNSLSAIMINLTSGAGAAGAAMADIGVSAFDAEGNFKGMEEVLQEVIGATSDLDEEQRTQILSMIAGKNQMKGFNALLDGMSNEYSDLKGDIGEANGALGEMAETMQDNAAGNVARLKSAFEELSISFSAHVLPAFSSLIEKATDVITWVGKLDESTQKQILTFAGLAAAVGPVLVVGGTLVSSLGAVFTAVGTISGAVSVLTLGATAATPAIGGLAAAFTFLTGPIGLGIAAVAGITVAGIALYKHLKEDAIPEIDRFGEGVSESTQKALGSFFELSDGASQSLMDMKINSTAVTDEMATGMIERYEEMNTKILEAMESRHAEELEKTRTFFMNSSVLSAEEEAKIIRQQEIRNETKAVSQQHYVDRIDEILRTAAEENRATTDIENKTIDALNAQMQENAVVYLSEGEVEQKIIRERMKETAKDLSHTQAAEVLKNSANARDKTIADAEATYNGSLAEIIRMRDETGEVSEEQATKLISAAAKTRDSTIDSAKDMHNGVVSEAEKQSKGLNEVVDLQTGEILAKWDVYKAGVVKRFKETNEQSLADFKRWGGSLKDWAGDAKDKVTETFDKMVEGAKKLPSRIGEGIGSMAFKVAEGVRTVSNKLSSGLGEGVNGVIGGINWVLDKIGVDEKKQLELWKVKKYANGTMGAHPGGLAILGDGRGSNAGPELIKTPSGEFGLSPSKDTLMNLPKGAEVLSARKTRELLGDVPKYENGVGGFLNKLWEGSKNLGSKVKDTAFNVWDHVSNPSKLLSSALSILGISAPSGGSFVGNMARGGYNKVKTHAIDYLKGKIDNSGTQAGSGHGFGSNFRLTSRRGFRINPVTGLGQIHQGDDWGAKLGTLIPAQAAGKVIQSGYHAIRGNYVRVQSGITDRLYQHNQRNMVRVGQSVRKGQAVGTVGSTGRSTGPHLHYEVRKNGININPAGLNTGGITNKEQFVRISEGDREEITIPMHESRRTDAMKLLAIAGRKLMPGGDKGITRPNQLPNISSNSRTDELLEKLIVLLENQKTEHYITVKTELDGQTLAEQIYKFVDDRINLNKQLTALGRGTPALG